MTFGSARTAESRPPQGYPKNNQGHFIEVAQNTTAQAVVVEGRIKIPGRSQYQVNRLIHQAAKMLS